MVFSSSKSKIGLRELKPAVFSSFILSLKSFSSVCSKKVAKDSSLSNFNLLLTNSISTFISELVSLKATGSSLEHDEISK